MYRSVLLFRRIGSSAKEKLNSPHAALARSGVYGDVDSGEMTVIENFLESRLWASV